MDTLLFRAYNKDTLKTWFYFGDSKCLFLFAFHGKSFCRAERLGGLVNSRFFLL